MPLQRSAWSAAIARSPITPKPGVELAGLGYYLNRRWDRVHDDINATAFVVSDGAGEAAAFLALDVLYIGEEEVGEIRRRAAARTGLGPEAICVNCSHSHNAPTMGLLEGAGEIDPEFVRDTIEIAASTLAAAWEKREPARFFVGSTRLTGFAYNRTRENGPVDERLGVLRAERADGSVLAVLFNFHAHPTVFYPVEPRSVSRDWPGRAIDLIERSLPGSMAIYLQGSCGDTQPLQKYWTAEHHREAGEIVFTAASEALRRARPIEASGVAAAVHQGPLPVRQWTREEVLAFYSEGKHRLETGDTTNWLNGIASKMVGNPPRLPERYNGSVERAVGAVSRFAVRWGEYALERLDAPAEPRRAEFQAIRIGDAWFVSNPAEFFTSLALEIRANWPHEDLFILGYSNGSISYLPDAYEVERASYASIHIPKAIRELPFTRDAGAAAVSASLEALRRVGQQPVPPGPPAKK